MKGIWYEYPQGIHLEPTRACNARCPQCMRTFFNTLETIPNLKITEIDPLWLDEKFKTDSLFKNVDNILINGNLGDIVMHSNPKALIQTMLDNGVKVISINTNGGALSENFWAWLGKQNTLGEFPKVIVNFAIDGLEDTHHLYRRNTRYDVVINNMKTFIAAGGFANAAVNVNGNNKHQMEELNDTLKDMGVLLNMERYNQRFQHDFIRCYDKNYRETYKLYSADRMDKKFDNFPPNFFKNKKREMQKEFSIKDFYNCESVQFGRQQWREVNTSEYQTRCYVNGDAETPPGTPTSFYLSADGRVWTCCWMETDYLRYVLYNQYSSMIDTYYYEIVNDPYFNSLDHHTGDEIINLDCFTKLRERWSSNRCPSVCVKQCGSREIVKAREAEVTHLQE